MEDAETAATVRVAEIIAATAQPHNPRHTEPIVTLTVSQQAALVALAEAPNQTGSAYGLRCSLTTLFALESKQYVQAIGLGHIAMPRNGNWKLTQTGQQVAQSYLANTP